MTKTIALLAIVTAGALVGCGNDAEPAATAPLEKPVAVAAERVATAAPAPAGPTHADFVATLDGLCRSFNAEAAVSDQSVANAISADDYDGAASALEALNVRSKAWDSDVATLDVPESDRASFGRYLRNAQQLDAYWARVASALRDRDEGEVTRLGRLMDAVRAKRATAAIELGLRDCGS
jgi:hypothetical protein